MKRTIFMLMTLVIGVIHPSANASSLLSCNDDKREIPIDVPKKKENPYSVIPLACYYSASLLKVGIRFKRLCLSRTRRPVKAGVDCWIHLWEKEASAFPEHQALIRSVSC